MTRYLVFGLMMVGCKGTQPPARAPDPAASGPSSPASTAASTTNATAPIEIVGKPIAITTLHLAGVGPDVKGEPNITQIKGTQNIMLDTDAFGVNVNPVGEFDSKTLAEAESDSKNYSATNFKGEKLPDGWSATYENVDTFFSNSYREINGRAYACGTAQPKALQRDRAVAFCKSLVAK